MSSKWDGLVERLVTGEIDMDHGEIREARRDPEFCDLLDETFATLAALDEPAILEAVDAETPPGGEAPVAEPARREIDPGAGWRRRGLLTVLGTVTAAVLLLFLFPFPGRDDARPPDAPSTLLGGVALECIAPAGERARFGVFRWRNDEPGGTYDVEVYDGTGQLLEGGASGPLGDVREWEPAAASVASWPDRIEWRLRWVRPGGGKAEIVFAEARR